MPNDRVSHGNSNGSRYKIGHVSHNINPDMSHRSIVQHRAFVFHKLSILADLCIFHQHLIEWNSHIIEAEKPVIDSVETDFVSDFPDGDSFPGLVRFFLSQLYDEWMQTVMFAQRIKLCENYCIVDGMT